MVGIQQESSLSLGSFLKALGVEFLGGTVGKNLLARAGTLVQSLVWEDSTRHRATKPMCYTY